MKIEVTRKEEVEVKTLIANMEPRYWEDATVNGQEDDDDNPIMPLTQGTGWILHIDLETGKIEGWPKGTTAQTHYKVCDAGIYTLLDKDGNVVMRKDGYVPSMLCPDDNGYGDYVIMKINGDGYIENFKADLRYFEESDY